MHPMLNIAIKAYENMVFSNLMKAVSGPSTTSKTTLGMS